MRAWIAENLSKHLFWVIPGVAGVLITLGLAWPQPHPVTVPVTTVQDQTFTWEGVIWDCGQVNTWNSQYGAYEPDGTRIPYEVILHCDMNPL